MPSIKRVKSAGTRSCWGRQRHYPKETILWRNRLSRFKEAKAEILSLLKSSSLTPDQAKTLLTSPLPELGGKSIKQCLKPVGIHKALKVLKAKL